MKAVFFDLFQTLVKYDPPREEIIARALKDYDIDIEPEALVQPIVAADQYMYQAMAVRPMGVRSSEERFALYVKHHEILFEKAGISIDPDIITEVLKRIQASDSSLKLFDDVIPALENLKRRGLILGLISNVDSDMSEQFEKLGLDRRLDVIMTSREADATKPSPEIFEAALDEAGVIAEDAVYVGDQYDIDIVGARNVGMFPILIDRTDYHADITDCTRIRTLAEVKNYL